MIDMLVPAGSGPPPHRHDFDETFHVSRGQLEVTFRGKTTLVTEGQTAVGGDLSDRASLEAAADGMDGVFLITPAFHPDAVRLGLNAVEAAVASGVGKWSTAAPTTRRSPW